MKKIDKDPFSNGTEHSRFETYNCEGCIRHSYLKADGTYANSDKNRMPRCSIQRDIYIRMMSNEPIKYLTIHICNNYTEHGVICPFRATERKKYQRKLKNQLSLDL